MATRSEFERVFSHGILTEPALSAAPAMRDRLAALASLTMESLGFTFCPEPVKLPKLVIDSAFEHNAAEPEASGIFAAAAAGTNRYLTAAEAAEVIRRVEAVDVALEILEAPMNGAGIATMVTSEENAERQSRIEYAIDVLRGAPPEPKREPVIELELRGNGGSVVQYLATDVSGRFRRGSLNRLGAIGALAEDLGLVRVKGATL